MYNHIDLKLLYSIVTYFKFFRIFENFKITINNYNIPNILIQNLIKIRLFIKKDYTILNVSKTDLQCLIYRFISHY